MMVPLILVAAMFVASTMSMSVRVAVVYPSNSSTPFSLRGDNCGLSWNTDAQMKWMKENTWSLDLSCEEAEKGKIFNMKARLGDTWQVGTNVMLTIQDNACTTIYPWFGEQIGSYAIEANLFSSKLNNSRNVIVYYPPSYQENTLKPYENVLIMHDGQNLFNDSTSFGGIAWNIQNTINPMIVEGSMEEIIVVGLYNTPNRNNEYTYSYDASLGFGGLGKVYIDWIESDVLPWARKNLRISPKKFGMLGSSLGGLISCWSGWTRGNGVWGQTGCMSSSFWWNNMDFNTTILDYAPPPKKTFYIDTGTNEGSDPALQVNQTLVVAERINDLGFTLGKYLDVYLDEGGQHNEYFWGKRFHVPMSALYSPTARTDTC